MNSIQEVIGIWQDKPEVHKLIHETFIQKVNEDDDLNVHRTWVEKHVFGFGERSFHWMHELIIKEMPQDFSFLEIGVYKSQVLSLYRLLADRINKKVLRWGVTPLDSSGGVWESDYAKDIEILHDQFQIKKDYTILKGRSAEPYIIERAKQHSKEFTPRKQGYDVLFIDGGHDFETALSDLVHYTPLVAPNGFLIVDDACNDMQMPFGYFQGIQSVTDAVKEWEKTQTDFEFLFNVVHNRVYRKK